MIVMCLGRGGERDWFPQYAAEGAKRGLGLGFTTTACPLGPMALSLRARSAACVFLRFKAKKLGRDHPTLPYAEQGLRPSLTHMIMAECY